MDQTSRVAAINYGPETYFLFRTLTFQSLLPIQRRQWRSVAVAVAKHYCLGLPQLLLGRCSYFTGSESWLPNVNVTKAVVSSLVLILDQCVTLLLNCDYMLTRWNVSEITVLFQKTTGATFFKTYSFYVSSPGPKVSHTSSDISKRDGSR